MLRNKSPLFQNFRFSYVSWVLIGSPSYIYCIQSNLGIQPNTFKTVDLIWLCWLRLSWFDTPSELVCLNWNIYSLKFVLVLNWKYVLFSFKLFCLCCTICFHYFYLAFCILSVYKLFTKTWSVWPTLRSKRPQIAYITPNQPLRFYTKSNR